MLLAMRPTTLTLDGFQGYRDPQEIDFSQVDRASITGRVGAGKSSMLDAINFALFGKVRVPTKDGVINTACDKATTELEFLERGGRYKVTRTLTRSGNAKAYLWRWDEDGYDWVTLGDQDGRVGATDVAVRDLIGLTWEAFRASVIVEQGKSAGFAEASPSERYSLLSQIVGLDRYAHMTEAASEQRKAVRTAITQTQARIEEQTALLSDAESVAATHRALSTEHHTLAAALDNLALAVGDAEKDADLARARLDLAQQQAHVATARASADQTLAQAERHANESAARVKSLTTATSLRDAAVAALTDARDSKAHAEEVVHQRVREGEEARDALSATTAARARASEELATIGERLAGLTRHGADGCFTCGQDLDDAQRAKVVGDLTARRATLEQEMRTLDEAIKSANAARERAVSAYKTATAEVTRAQQAIDSAARPVADAERAAEELPGAQRNAEEAVKTVAAARDARAALDTGDGPDLATAQNAWSTAQVRVNSARNSLAQAKDGLADGATRIAVLADRMERHDAAREAIASLNAALVEHRADEAGWTRLIDAYSPSGVPRMILDTAIADINIDLDVELSALSGGALTASLDTQRATKAGTMKSEITLTVVGQDGARVYESFSGGQRFLVDLALHLALTKTLARRNGSALDFLAIDEGWGAIEGEEREAVLRALHELASEHNALLLAITHVQEVADSFPTRIETEMISGTSITTIH